MGEVKESVDPAGTVLADLPGYVPVRATCSKSGLRDRRAAGIRSGKLNRGCNCLAFPFGGCCLGQDRTGELPCLGDGKGSPPGPIAAGAVPEVHEDPRGGMPCIPEG